MAYITFADLVLFANMLIDFAALCYLFFHKKK